MRIRSKWRSGQVVVEMLLILPVFLGMVFMIMEIGYISFRLIVLNHATYEAARVGGMTWFSRAGIGKVAGVMQKMLPEATVQCAPEKTMRDPQADQDNYDLICTGTEDVALIFPISSVVLAKPARSGKRRLVAVVRMPIEQPLKK